MRKSISRTSRSTEDWASAADLGVGPYQDEELYREMPVDVADPVVWAVDGPVLQGGCEHKAIEECKPGDHLDLVGFVVLEEGDRPGSIELRLDNGYRYSETRGGKVRGWRSAR